MLNDISYSFPNPLLRLLKSWEQVDRSQQHLSLTLCSSSNPAHRALRALRALRVSSRPRKMAHLGGEV